MNISDQYFEYHLPAGAMIHASVSFNGGTPVEVTLPFSGDGTDFFPESNPTLVAPYFTLEYQVDTVIDGEVVYTSILTTNCPDETASIVNQTPGAGASTCLVIPEGAVVGDMPNNTQAFYAPGKISADVIINAGTYWVIGEDESGGYYKIVLGCQYLWVPVD